MVDHGFLGGGIVNDLKALDIFEARKGNLLIQRKTIEGLFIFAMDLTKVEKVACRA